MKLFKAKLTKVSILMTTLFYLSCSFPMLGKSFDPTPEKTDPSYAAIVEAGAQLLALDVARTSQEPLSQDITTNIDNREKEIVTQVAKLNFISHSRTFDGLVPIEHIAHIFSDIAPLIHNLHIALLAQVNPESFKSLGGVFAYLNDSLCRVKLESECCESAQNSALQFAPTATFLKALQTVVYQYFSFHEHELSKSTYFLYDILRQTLSHVFHDIIKEYLPDGSLTYGPQHFKLPAGEYQKRCKDCHYDGKTLSCICGSNKCPDGLDFEGFDEFDCEYSDSRIICIERWWNPSYIVCQLTHTSLTVPEHWKGDVTCNDGILALADKTKNEL